MRKQVWHARSDLSYRISTTTGPPQTRLRLLSESGPKTKDSTSRSSTCINESHHRSSSQRDIQPVLPSQHGLHTLRQLPLLTFFVPGLNGLATTLVWNMRSNTTRHVSAAMICAALALSSPGRCALTEHDPSLGSLLTQEIWHHQTRVCWKCLELTQAPGKRRSARTRCCATSIASGSPEGDRGLRWAIAADGHMGLTPLVVQLGLAPGRVGAIGALRHRSDVYRILLPRKSGMPLTHAGVLFPHIYASELQETLQEPSPSARRWRQLCKAGSFLS